MSSFAVRVERVSSVQPHPNADRLDIIQVLGWNCVAQKGAFKEGDLCVYFPIDSVLPEKVESAIFGPDAKVKLHKSRVKTIKLRGAISQGLCVSPTMIEALLRLHTTGGWYEKCDLTDVLGVTKYEPLVSDIPRGLQPKTSKKQANPHFKKYTDLENAKNYPSVFHVGEDVIFTEKIHGTNFRAGWVPIEVNTLWKRVLRFFGRLPQYEFVYGSRNVQMQDGRNRKTWIQQHNGVSKNVYEEAVDKYRLRDVIPAGMVVYGEVYGDGVQKGYTYGCKPGERKLALFDIYSTSKQAYLDPEDFLYYASRLDLPVVPVVHQGPYTADLAKSLTSGPSVLSPEQKVREGVVAKPLAEASHPLLGRKVLKFISDDYLLKDQSDFH